MAQIDERLDPTPAPVGKTAGDPARSAAAGQAALSVSPELTPSSAPARPQSGARYARRRLVVLLLAAALLLAGFLGFRYWQDQQLYISTDNAQVAGSLVQVGTMNAGRVASVAVDVGDRIGMDQVAATVAMPSVLATTASGTPRMGFRGTDDQSATVESPVDGVVVARLANPGDTVAAGQPLFTVVDPNRLWVQAQIEETKVGRVRVGQAVEVTFDSLGRTLPGRVIAVDRATSATFSLLPQGNTSGNFTKVAQLVPVKIAVDYGQAPLMLGSSVEVRIRVQD